MIKTTGIVSFIHAKFGGKTDEHTAKQRLDLCKSCVTLAPNGERLYREIAGQSYCGIPRLEHILRSEQREGCGCNLTDKVSYKSSACPVGHWLPEGIEKGDAIPCCHKNLFPGADITNSIDLHLANNDAVLVPVNRILALVDIASLNFMNAATEVQMFNGASILVRENTFEIKELKDRLRINKIDNWTPEVLKREAARYDLEVVTHDWPRIVFSKKGVSDVKMAVTLDADKPGKTLEKARRQFVDVKMQLPTEVATKKDPHERDRQSYRQLKRKSGCKCRH